MSQVVGFLVLAGVAFLMVAKLAAQLRDVYFQRRILAVERIAVEEYRRNRPIDRVAIVRDLVGALSPAYAQTQAPRLEADDKGPTVFETARRIGTVHVGAAMTPCDGVNWLSSYYTCRDFGDENDAREDAQTEGSNDLHLASPNGAISGKNARADAGGSDLVWASLFAPRGAAV